MVREVVVAEGVSAEALAEQGCHAVVRGVTTRHLHDAALQMARARTRNLCSVSVSIYLNVFELFERLHARLHHCIAV